MKDPVSRFNRLKKKVEEADRIVSKAEGALEEKMARLRTEFGCDSLDDANRLAAKLKARIDKDRPAFEAMLTEFESAHGEALQ